MNTALPPSSSGFDRPVTYRIRVLGRVPTRWRDHLEGMVLSEITDEFNQQITILEGELNDQSALAGLLNTIVDLHLVVLTVEQLPVDDVPAPEAAPSPLADDSDLTGGVGAVAS